MRQRLSTRDKRGASALRRGLLVGASALAFGVFGAFSTFPAFAADDSGLLGRWTFDEATDADPLQNAANPDAPGVPDRPIPRVDGVFGAALDLSGAFQIPLAQEVVGESLDALTLTAWVRPRNLSGYREIVRKEDDDLRYLFSFQNDGTILSLGLNIGGYFECDAPISPADVLDGSWRFAAATFDGETARVYLDGREIGALKRPGKIVFGKKAPSTIGSNGASEFFDGSLDDLRCYSRALSADELAAMFDEGRKSIDAREAAAVDVVKSFYDKKETFVETLSAARRAFADDASLRDKFDRTTQSVFSRFVRSDFPEDADFFARRFQLGIGEFLTAPTSRMKEEALRVRELYAEYKPLTDEQRSRLTPEETARWRRVEEVEKRFDEALANASENDPVWFELAFETSRSIQERPVEREPVAPYRKPETPATVDLTEEQARAALEKDWLFQCDGVPTLERVRFELERTAKSIDEFADSDSAFESERAELKELNAAVDAFEASDDAQNADKIRDLYFRVRTLKRAVFFQNPVVDFDSVLFVDSPYPEGSEWRHETRHRLGYMAVPGGRLTTLTGLSPGGKQRTLAPSAPLHGSFWRPDLSFDATKVLFSFKPHNEKAFHLYEVDLNGDAAPRQLTGGPFDDLDPIYLPDGENIAFSTTRGYSYVRCMPPTNAFVLARMKLGSPDVYLISRNNEPDYLPSLLPDGRIVYSRWEYTDKPLWRCVALWTTNPDGTQTQVLWGNQTVWPDLPKDVRAIPNSSRLMFVGSAHHDWFAGSVGIIDPTKGLNFPDGLTKVTADVDWPECGNGPVDPIESPDYRPAGKYSAYDSPYPLDERTFLVSACRDGKYVLLLMNVDGDRELIFEGAYNVLYAQPIRPREVPPTIVDRVKWPTRETAATPAPGIVYSNDVYEGAPEELRGKAKYLRIMNIEPKTYTLWNDRPYISTGPVVSMVQSEGVKRILGTVPIEEDGSVSFYAPSGVALHFQLLDENKKCLQTMRSFTGVMPGESRGCVGCHESQIATPSPQVRSIATLREPSTITPPAWDDVSVGFDRYVRPVLDKHCDRCHSGDGEAREIFDTTERPGFLHFNEPYITLIGNPSWAAPPQIYRSGSRTTWGSSPEPELPAPPPGFGIADTIQVEAYATVDPAGYETPRPMTKLSYASRLINKYCVKEHYGVELDPIEMERTIVWVDAMCPYLGTEEIRALPDPKFQGSDWLSVPPRLATAPVVRRPGPFDAFESLDGPDGAYVCPTDAQIYGNPADQARPTIRRFDPERDK